MARPRKHAPIEVPKGTTQKHLKRIGGFDLGLYYHVDETHKWKTNIDQFERLVICMQEELEGMKREA
tara:strand:+ start:941 stop:1141 length:201 start_codon:yes stop_codon:yes gene_type:complete